MYLLLVLKQLRSHVKIVPGSFKQEGSLLGVAAGHRHQGTHQERQFLVKLLARRLLNLHFLVRGNRRLSLTIPTHLCDRKLKKK